jgi:hypothetical protein
MEGAAVKLRLREITDEASTGDRKAHKGQGRTG